MPLNLPFEHLNLRYNPFGERTPEQRVALAVVDATSWKEHLQQPGTAIQFIGPCGRGKSTHLLKLHSLFPGIPRIRVRADEKIHLPQTDFLFVDGVDHLPFWQRYRLFRQSSRLAFTTHEVDYRRTLRRHGMRCEHVNVRITSAAQLRPIFDTRLEAARRGPGPIPTLPQEILETLFSRFGDDIRGMEGALYQWLQQMQQPGPIKPPHLSPKPSTTPLHINGS